MKEVGPYVLEEVGERLWHVDIPLNTSNSHIREECLMLEWMDGAYLSILHT